MRNIIFLLSLSSVVSACNTTYKVPQEPAPALWQGSSGVLITGKSYKVIPGIHQPGGVFAEIDADHKRKARLLAPVTYETTVMSGSKEVTLPAGTPLYAQQYTQSVTTSGTYVQTKTVTQARSRNPIEWCAERPDKEQAVCIFWENPNEAFYLGMRGSPVGPQVGTIAGKRGPLPSLVEDSNIKFRNDLKLAIQVGRISKKYIYIQQKYGSVVEGEFDGTVVSYQKKQWDDNGTVNLKISGGEFLLKAIKDEPKSKPRAVEVSVIKQPSLPSEPLGNLSAQDRAKLLELLLKASEPKEK